MSTTNTIGVPKLLPTAKAITATFAVPVVLMHTAMCYNVIKARIETSTLLGRDSSTSTSTNPAMRSTVTIDGATGANIVSDPLLVATSIHSNFLENVPLGMLFAAAVELNGGNRRALTGVLSALMFFRVAHAYGLMGGIKALRFRQAGFFGTMGALLGLGGWASWLVRGYWEL